MSPREALDRIEAICDESRSIVRVEEVRAVLDNVFSDGWADLWRILDTIYPESMLPQKSRDADYGNGPQVVSLLRLLGQAEAKLARIAAVGDLDGWLVWSGTGTARLFTDEQLAEARAFAFQVLGALYRVELVETFS